MSSPAASVVDPNRIPIPRNSGGRRRESRCGLKGSRIRAYECPRWSARCRLQEDPQTTRHKAERHEEVRAHEDATSDTRLRTHASSVLTTSSSRRLPNRHDARQFPDRLSRFDRTELCMRRSGFRVEQEGDRLPVDSLTPCPNRDTAVFTP